MYIHTGSRKHTLSTNSMKPIGRERRENTVIQSSAVSHSLPTPALLLIFRLHDTQPIALSFYVRYAYATRRWRGEIRHNNVVVALRLLDNDLFVLCLLPSLWHPLPTSLNCRPFIPTVRSSRRKRSYYMMRYRRLYDPDRTQRRIVNK